MWMKRIDSISYMELKRIDSINITFPKEDIAKKNYYGNTCFREDECRASEGCYTSQ